MTLQLLLAHVSTMGQALQAVDSPYPPSFDNNPVIFGWALFSRMLVCSLSLATLLRIRMRNIAEGLSANHPVYYHRMLTACFLWGAALGSLSDVATYLFWGEVTVGVTQVVMLISRLLDAFTMIPFLMALCVPVWVGWLCRIGILSRDKFSIINGLVHDVRAMWSSPSVPLKLIAYSAIGSGLVTVAKYWLWLEHGRF